jgi:hypothetical protein
MHRITRLGSLLVVAGLAATLAPASAASAAWSAGGSGHAGSAAATMPTGVAPTATALASQVTVGWPTASFSNGSAVGGYVVNRYNAVSGARATVGAGCNGIITTTSCTEASVPAGTWVYTDTPVQSSWTGGESQSSAAVTVR